MLAGVLLKVNSAEIMLWSELRACLASVIVLEMTSREPNLWEACRQLSMMALDRYDLDLYVKAPPTAFTSRSAKRYLRFERLINPAIRLSFVDKGVSLCAGKMAPFKSPITMKCMLFEWASRSRAFI